MKTLIVSIFILTLASCKTELKVTSKTDNNIEVKTFKRNGVEQSYIIIKSNRNATGKEIAKGH